MTRWSEDRLGLGLVATPLVGIALACVGVAAHTDWGVVLYYAGSMLPFAITYVLAGMDATRRGQTASILILLLWIVGYPLHLRSRQRYPGSYFGFGSGLLVVAGWFAGIYVASALASMRAHGS